MPVIVIANLAITLALAVSSVVWVPSCAILKYLFNALLFDTEHACYGARWFPLITTILRAFIQGIFSYNYHLPAPWLTQPPGSGAGQLVLSTVSAFFVHPLFAALIGMCYSTTYSQILLHNTPLFN